MGNDVIVAAKRRHLGVLRYSVLQSRLDCRGFHGVKTALRPGSSLGNRHKVHSASGLATIHWRNANDLQAGRKQLKMLTYLALSLGDGWAHGIIVSATSLESTGAESYNSDKAEHARPCVTPVLPF